MRKETGSDGITWLVIEDGDITTGYLTPGSVSAIITPMENTAKHEAHGHCTVCHIGVHCYPFGWAHVNVSEKCMDYAPAVKVTCCEAHKVRYAAVGR